MYLAALIGVLGLLPGRFAAVPLLRLIRTPAAIFNDAAQYLRIYLLGYPFLRCTTLAHLRCGRAATAAIRFWRS